MSPMVLYLLYLAKHTDGLHDEKLNMTAWQVLTTKKQSSSKVF